MRPLAFPVLLGGRVVALAKVRWALASDRSIVPGNSPAWPCPSCSSWAFHLPRAVRSTSQGALPPCFPSLPEDSSRLIVVLTNGHPAQVDRGEDGERGDNDWRCRMPVADPSHPTPRRASRTVLAHHHMPSVLDAYDAFDRREPGWTKVALERSGDEPLPLVYPPGPDSFVSKPVS